MLKIAQKLKISEMESLETKIFPHNLKLIVIPPVFKKKDPLYKTNYRPVSVKVMQNQVNGFVCDFFYHHTYVVTVKDITHSRDR